MYQNTKTHPKTIIILCKKYFKVYTEFYFFRLQTLEREFNTLLIIH